MIPNPNPKAPSWERLPGQILWFEYHCLESAESADAEAWYRSHQQVTVLGRNPGEGFADDWTPEERYAEGCPITYQVRWADGFEWAVWEDELVDSPDEFYRPDPPANQ